MKTMRGFLKPAILDDKLGYKESKSLLIQVEEILNSRSFLSPSNDLNDFLPITLSHFLIGRPISLIPKRPFQLVDYLVNADVSAILELL